MLYILYELLGIFLLFPELYILFVVILINIIRGNNKILSAFKQKEPMDSFLLCVFVCLFA